MEPFSQASVPDEIRNNPFRMLGCLSSAATRERISCRNRLAAFARVGRPCPFPTDFTGLFGEVRRSAEDIDRAERALELPEDRIRHALFWFCRADSADDAALERLRAGDTPAAEETWEERNTFSSRIGLSVLATCRDDVDGAMTLVTSFIHDEAERGAFLSMLGLDAAGLGEDELIRIYFETLGRFLPWRRIVDEAFLACSDADVARVEAMAAAPSIRRIERAVASRTGNGGPDEADGLLQETEDDLALLDEVLDPDDLDRSRVHDRLADSVRSMALNASNANRCDEEIQARCLALAERAFNLSEGETAVSDCDATIEKIRENLKLSRAGACVKVLEDVRNLFFTPLVDPPMQEVAQYVGTVEGILLKMKSHFETDVVQSAASSYFAIVHNTIISILNKELTNQEGTGSWKSDSKEAVRIVDRILKLPLTDEAEEHFSSLRERILEWNGSHGGFGKNIPGDGEHSFPVVLAGLLLRAAGGILNLLFSDETEERFRTLRRRVLKLNESLDGVFDSFAVMFLRTLFWIMLATVIYKKIKYY